MGRAVLEMVPAQILEDSDTNGCTPLRIPSRKSQSLRKISGAHTRRPRREGVQCSKSRYSWNSALL